MKTLFLLFAIVAISVQAGEMTPKEKAEVASLRAVFPPKDYKGPYWYTMDAQFRREQKAYEIETKAYFRK